MINDVVYFAGEIANLIKAFELEKAALLAADALRMARTTDLGTRQASVHQITLNLAELRRQRERLHDAVEALPDAEKRFARAQIEEICRHLFDGEIAALQTSKRQLSRPAR